MKGKMPTGRIIATFLAAIFVVLAVRLFMGANKAYDWFEQLKKAEPLSMQVDFSKTGRYSAPFHQTYYSLHGLLLCLKSPSGDQRDNDGLKTLEGVQGKISITDANGRVLTVRDFSADDFSKPSLSDEHDVYAEFILHTKRGIGDFTFTVDVEKPAASISNGHQLLTGRYIMCGLELVGAAIMKLGGIVAAGIGMAIVAGVVVTTLKHRKRTATKQSADIPS